MSWKIKEGKYAGHKISIRFYEYKNTLEARISGPRASSIGRDYYANNVEWKIKTVLPFTSPSVSKVESKAWPIYNEAKKRIDNAIAEHAKKHEDDYQ